MSGANVVETSIALAGQEAPFGTDLLFRSGGTVGVTFHVEICEDIWVPVPPSSHAAMAGAEVLVKGEAWDEADAYAQTLVAKGAGYVPPFDHPLLWEGHATLVDEMLDQIPAGRAAPDAVVVAVGGGGLLCGVAEGLERRCLTDTAIVAVETEGAASFAGAVAAGELVTLPAITTIASTLGARRVTAQALDWAGRRPITPVVVSDADAVRGIARFADDHQCLVEPACGAALSLAYDDHPALKPYRRVAVIACGGIAVSLATLAGWRARFGV